MKRHPLELFRLLRFWYTRRELCDDLGWHQDAVDRNLRELEHAGMLRRRFHPEWHVRGGSTPFQFQLLRSNEWPTTPRPDTRADLAALIVISRAADGMRIKELAAATGRNDKATWATVRWLGPLLHVDRGLLTHCGNRPNWYHLSKGWHV